MDGIKDLIDAIDIGLSNRYKITEGFEDTLYVKDRETGTHYEIKVNECEED